MRHGVENLEDEMIALMFRQDSMAGLVLASIVLRWMPFDQKSWPPSNTMTRVGRERAWRNASRSRVHWDVLIARAIG
jgi:hypothetical protein